MRDIILGSDVKIHNAKIIHPNYPNEFHEFLDNNRNTLTIYLILPGIIPDSMQIEVEDCNLKIKMYIRKSYRIIYKAMQIRLSGKLSHPVLSKAFASNYEDGIVKINFILNKNLS